jgi:hypothetical protein
VEREPARGEGSDETAGRSSRGARGGEEMRIEVEAYVEVKEDKVEIAVQLPDTIDIDELDILSEELHFDVDDPKSVWLVVTFKKQKPSNDDNP